MADASDIVARLRSYSVADGGNGCYPPPVAAEAADEIERLRADMKILAFGDPVHTHACPYWRFGKKHGPCVCGAKEIQDQVDAARARCNPKEPTCP